VPDELVLALPSYSYLSIFYIIIQSSKTSVIYNFVSRNSKRLTRPTSGITVHSQCELFYTTGCTNIYITALAIGMHSEVHRGVDSVAADVFIYTVAI